MNSVKLNKKHLFSFVITLVLLFSLNLNVFAGTSNIIHFGDYSYRAYYYPNGTFTDCTNNVTCGTAQYTIDGVTMQGTNYIFSGTSTYDKLLYTGADLGLYTDTQYTYDFYVKVGLRSGYTYNVVVQIYYTVNGELVDTAPATTLYDGDGLATNTWHKVEGSFKTPDVSGNVACALLVMISTQETDSTSQMMCLSDMSLVLDDPLLNGTPIGTPSTDELNGAIEDYENVMNELPSIDGEELDRLLNFDFDSFTSGMSFVRDMFDRTMSVFGFTSVLSFALAIGLATYLIGRKVG